MKMFRLTNKINKIHLKLNKGIIVRNIETNSKITEFYENAKNNAIKLNPFELTIKYISCIFGFPFGFNVVKANHTITLFTFGKFDGYRTSGLTWIPPISNQYETYCGDITLNHSDMHLTDSSSNPLRVSSFITYNITNPVNSIVNLQNKDVLSNWIENIIRHTISTHTYEQLTTYAKDEILNSVVQTINSHPNADFYGINVKKAGLLQINYAPEIAETMLVKQKAKATIEARKELVDATINLIEDIGNKLESKLSQEDKSKLITCLTISMIGTQSPSQVINLN